MIYKLQNGGTIPLGGDYLEYLQNTPEVSGGSIQPSIKTEKLPEKFHGSQRAARTYAEGYQKGAKPVTKAIDNAGQKIFNGVKTIAMFVPGPVGTITGLGQMGADTVNGEYGKVARDVGAAALMGVGLKGIQAGAKAAGRTLAGKGVNIPGLDAYDYSALRGQYFDNAGNKAMVKAIPDIVQTNIEAGKIGGAPSLKQILGHNSDQPLTKLEIRFPAWDTTQRGAPLGHSGFTGTETAQGFMGKRPYHLKGMVELNKPMIQIGESIGDGKNATRNQILDFAQKSSADGINFKGIADNTLKNQDVYVIFKNTEVRPKLTAAEQLGIPKQNRISLNQDQTEAADDLLGYLRNGRHKKYFLYNPETETFRGSSSKSKDGEIGAVRALVEHGATSSGYYEDAPVRLSNEYGNFTIGPNKNAAFTSNFPIPEGMKGGPGETSLMLEGDHSMKTILTSPRVDLYNSMEDAPIELVNSLPNTIDKSIMRRFGSENDHMIRPGTYLSGDNGQMPLGNIAINTFDRTKSVDSAIQSIINPENSRTGRTGLSPDSYSSIIRQGLRGNHKLRGGEGFTKGNDSAVENKAIYEAGKRMKAGEITPEQYKQIFDDWAIPLGGRPAEIRTTPSFRTITDNNGITRTIAQEPQKYVVMPHPYIMYRKQGGIIKGQNGFLNTWQKAYNSKFGKGLRDFMFGKDRDLSDEEYFEKYGYNKPVGSIGVLGALVAPEGEGLEIPEITAQHIGNQGKVLRWFENGNSKILKVPVKETSKKASNGQKFLKLSQQEQDDFVRRGNGESFQGFATLKGDKQALGRFRSGINSRK